MPSKIFKDNITDEYFYGFLDTICLKTENYYQIDNNSYKKMLYNDYHIDFIEELRKHYNVSKQIYLTRELTYNSFINIIRQICKSKDIKYEKNINYNKSKYSIIYLIYYKNI